jgi:hypothetical protein
MTLESILIAADAIWAATALILLLGLFAVAWSVYRHQRSSETSLFQRLGNEERGLYSKVYTTASMFRNSEGDKKGDKESVKEEYNIALRNYLNFLDNVALMVNEGRVAGTTARNYFGRVVSEAVGSFNASIFPRYRQLTILNLKWSKS